jgi:DtxR family Mn-dependent transcriptional regulator
MSTSENLEMYLVTIALLEEQGVEIPVGLSRLAEELQVQPVSVNQMVRKLDEEGLVTYQPYKGVVLTEKGKQLTTQIIRHRRLWEVFFVKNLDISPKEADALACRMEHVTTQEIAARLYKFLGEPQVTPGGKAIPHDDQEGSLRHGLILNDLHVGQKAEVAQILAGTAETSFLNSQGFSPGQRIEVIAASSNGDVLVDTGKNKLSLIETLAKKIRVHPLETSNNDEL